MSHLEDSARSDGGDAVAPATVSEKPERLRIVPKGLALTKTWRMPRGSGGLPCYLFLGKEEARSRRLFKRAGDPSE